MSAEQKFEHKYAESLYKFSGVISSITPDGNCALVRLSSPVRVGDRDDTVNYAVITHETVGRIHMLNGVGHFIRDLEVFGEGRRAPDGLMAVSVKAREEVA